jgi:hypothetical protein
MEPTPEPSRPDWSLFGLVVLVLAGIGFFFVMAVPTYTHRYRLTVEIDTPDGVRSGSSVIEVARIDDGWIPIRAGSRYTFRLRGEAMFVDLGGGRNVIALLAHGSQARDVNQMISLPIEAYGHRKWDEDAWAGRKAMQGPVELKPPLIPTLITFTDLDDPATAQVVYGTEPRGILDRFADVFGPNVRFKRVWIETVSTGIWPFSSFGWPRSLAGEPVTRQLEAKVPWWNSSGRPAVIAWRAWLAGQSAGPATEPEAVFVRAR